MPENCGRYPLNNSSVGIEYDTAWSHPFPPARGDHGVYSSNGRDVRTLRQVEHGERHALGPYDGAVRNRQCNGFRQFKLSTHRPGNTPARIDNRRRDAPAVHAHPSRIVRREVDTITRLLYDRRQAAVRRHLQHREGAHAISIDISVADQRVAIKCNRGVTVVFDQPPQCRGRIVVVGVEHQKRCTANHIGCGQHGVGGAERLRLLGKPHPKS